MACRIACGKMSVVVAAAAMANAVATTTRPAHIAIRPMFDNEDVRTMRGL